MFYDIIIMEGKEMNRDEARNKTVDLLLGDKNPNANYYASLFEQYNYGDAEMTPISPAGFGHVNINNNVVITEDAYRKLVEIRNITLQTGREVPFFIFGEEKPNGTVWLDTVVSTYKPSTRTIANFSAINHILDKYLNDIKSGVYNNGNKQVVCHGHTHGKTPVSDNFSFGDMISYVQFNNAHPMFKNRQIETMALLMPPSGDFNFIMYENNPQYEGFYTFPNVYLRYDNSNAVMLPAYQNGNYLVRNENVVK